MATSLSTTSEDAPAFEVAARMEREKLRHMLVARGDTLLGLVDRAKLLRHLVRHTGHALPDCAIHDFLLRDPVTIAPDARADEAVRLMRQHRIGSLPVVENGVLVGLLSERRLLAYAESLLARAGSASPSS